MYRRTLISPPPSEDDCLVSPKVIAVGVLSSIALAVSGCGGGSDAEAESLRVTTTKRVETQPRTHPAVDIAQFRAAFKKAYGTPPNRMPWYGLITGMKMNGTSLVITTKLPPSSARDAKEGNWGDAGEICRAGTGLALDLGLMNRKQSAIEWAHVVGTGGGIVSCA
jgi:hypothetical protein